MGTDLAELQGRLWEAADQLRANSGLKASEYSTPVLGLIFLRYADLRFAEAHADLEGRGSARRTIGPADYHAKGVLYLPEAARFVERQRKNPARELSIYGQEKTRKTVKLAVHGLAEEIAEANTYYDNIHQAGLKSPPYKDQSNGPLHLLGRLQGSTRVL